MKPYKVRPFEIGAAEVIDRATDERVGYVLAAYRGWHAFLESDPGHALRVGTWHCERLDRTFDVIECRTRAVAAEKVWEVVTA